ncbi:MAG: hypothetical protein AAF492_21030, partial [Verrucomicrobiota bacterium]
TPDAFSAWDEAWQENFDSLNPLSQILIPSIRKAWAAQAKMTIRRDMLQTGLGVLRQGPELLERRKDPISEARYIYRKTATGFELESTFESNDKPVVMRFGGPRD